MDKFQKFLKKADAKLRQRLRSAMDAIIENRLDGLDVKPLAGQKGYYRCRVGDVRIIFVRIAGENVLCSVAFRGSAYKK